MHTFSLVVTLNIFSDDFAKLLYLVNIERFTYCLVLPAYFIVVLRLILYGDCTEVALGSMDSEYACCDENI